MDADETRDDSGHYFDRAPAVASDPVTVDVVLPDTAFAMETDRGVFGRGRLDVGTSLLLRTTLPLAASGDLLDLGCGTGAIALTMARRAPGARIWAVDVNDRARHLCAANAARNDIENVTVAHPDEVPAEIRFATIWSNPPIRVGKAALHELLRRWFARLAPGGSAALVVHRHLGADSLHHWLIEQGWPTGRVASKSGFRILAVSPADRPAA